MELEKLNEIWTTLNEKMQNQKGLEKTIIKTMLLERSGKSLGRLINYSYLGIIVLLVCLPVMIKIMSLSSSFKWIVASIIVLFIICIIVNIIQLILLYKVDFAYPITKNIRLVQNVNIFNKNSEIIIYSLGILLLFIIVIAYFVLIKKIESWMLALMIVGLLIGIAGAVWEYKSFYRKNFNSILNSLKELKELNEPEDISE